MKKPFLLLMFVLFLMGGTISVTGCQQQGPLEEIGEEIDDEIDDATDG